MATYLTVQRRILYPAYGVLIPVCYPLALTQFSALYSVYPPAFSDLRIRLVLPFFTSLLHKFFSCLLHLYQTPRCLPSLILICLSSSRYLAVIHFHFLLQLFCSITLSLLQAVPPFPHSTYSLRE